MSGISFFLGGMAVLVLFVGQILLLAPLFDWWDNRAKAAEAANPGQASLKAELLVRRLGEAVLEGVHAIAWLSGLLVLPLLIVIVHGGSWIMLPAVFALTLVQGVVCSWTSRKLEALKGGILSQLR